MFTRIQRAGAVQGGSHQHGLEKQPGQPLGIRIEAESGQVVGVLVHVARKHRRVEHRQPQAHSHAVPAFEQEQRQPQANFHHARRQHNRVLIQRHKIGHLSLEILPHEGEVASASHDHEGAQQPTGYVLERGGVGLVGHGWRRGLVESLGIWRVADREGQNKPSGKTIETPKSPKRQMLWTLWYLTKLLP